MSNHKNRRFLALCFGCIAEFITCGIILLVWTWVRQSNFVSDHSRKNDTTEKTLQKLRYRHIAANAILMFGPLPLFAYAFDWKWKHPAKCRSNGWISVAGYAFGLFNATALTYTARIMSRVSDVVLALKGSSSMNNERLYLKYGIYFVCYSLTLLWYAVELLMLVSSGGKCTYEMDVKLDNSTTSSVKDRHSLNYYLRHITAAFFISFLFGILVAVILLTKVEKTATKALNDLMLDNDSLKEAKSSLKRLQRIRNGFGVLWLLLCSWFIVISGLKITDWAVSPLGNSCRNGLVTCAINFVALNYVKPRRKTIMVFEQHLSDQRKERKATLLEQQRRDQQQLMIQFHHQNHPPQMSPIRINRGPFAVGCHTPPNQNSHQCKLNRGLLMNGALLKESGSSTKGTGGEYGSAAVESSQSLSTTLLTEITDDSVLNSRWTTLIHNESFSPLTAGKTHSST